MHSKSPCRRRDEGVRSAGEDDSENWGFRNLKKYYVYRYCCPTKDVKKWRTRWRGCRLLYLLFCTVYCSGNRLKINITPYGGNSIIQLTELKFKIWRVTFLKIMRSTSVFQKQRIYDVHMHLRWRNPCNWNLDLFRLSSLVLASKWSSNRTLFVVLLGMTKCMHRTTPYHTNGNYRTLPSMFPFVPDFVE